MTPHEILYLKLASLNFPDTIYDLKVEYWKDEGNCDIILSEDITIAQKLGIMNKIIEKLGNVEYQFNTIKKYEPIKQMSLF